MKNICGDKSFKKNISTEWKEGTSCHLIKQLRERKTNFLQSWKIRDSVFYNQVAIYCIQK